MSAVAGATEFLSSSSSSFKLHTLRSSISRLYTTSISPKFPSNPSPFSYINFEKRNKGILSRVMTRILEKKEDRGWELKWGERLHLGKKDMLFSRWDLEEEGSGIVFGKEEIVGSDLGLIIKNRACSAKKDLGLGEIIVCGPWITKYSRQDLIDGPAIGSGPITLVH